MTTDNKQQAIMKRYCHNKQQAIMKRYCHNKQQAIMKRYCHNVKWAARNIIGGLQNCISDEPEDSKDRIESEKLLTDRDELMRMVYEAAVTNVYGPGTEACSEWARRQTAEFRLLGRIQGLALALCAVNHTLDFE